MARFGEQHLFAHKDFAEQGILHASNKREALRARVEDFIDHAIGPERVLSVSEMSVYINNVFSVTVRYRRD